MKYLSYGHYAVTDKEAGRLAKATPRGRLPRVGYELCVDLPNGKRGWLTRTKLLMTDPIKNKRGWVWTVRWI